MKELRVPTESFGGAENVPFGYYHLVHNSYKTCMKNKSHSSNLMTFLISWACRSLSVVNSRTVPGEAAYN